MRLMERAKVILGQLKGRGERMAIRNTIHITIHICTRVSVAIGKTRGKVSCEAF